MINEEAIEYLKLADTTVGKKIKTRIAEALEMAIRALKNEQTDGDLISRQAVIDSLYALCDTGETLKENPWRDNPHIDAITDTIDALPSVTPQMKSGKWILLDECSNSGYYCSECHKKVIKEGWSNTVKKIKYCPNCGTKMEEEE